MLIEDNYTRPSNFFVTRYTKPETPGTEAGDTTFFTRRGGRNSQMSATAGEGMTRTLRKHPDYNFYRETNKYLSQQGPRKKGMSTFEVRS